MSRILMLAAFVFLSLNSDAQSDNYGGVGGPYTPMKYVVHIDSVSKTEDDSVLPADDSTDSQHPKLQTTELNAYGKTLSSLTEK